MSETDCLGQISETQRDSIFFAAEADRQKALDILDHSDTTSYSTLWPNIKPSLFFANVRKNILFPAQINQGKATNFCGYAAFTHELLRFQPQTYVKHILSLYRTGETDLPKKKIKASNRIRSAAGTLRFKGELDILHADQLWFLTLADNFKGYLNIFDSKYNIGNENAIWAATNYSKFNRMLKEFGDYRVTAAGSDMIRPMKKNFYNYITNQLQQGVVWLYINGKYLHPTRHSFLTLRAPTHFIVLYRMYRVDDMIEIQYWDYGLKTQQLITKKRLRKLIFGVTRINSK